MKPRFSTPLVITLAALALQLSPGAASVLEFDRSALARGELWRLVTGHLVHFNTSHLVWDLLGLLLLGAPLHRLSGRDWSWLLGGSALVISVGVWVLAPALETYRGLSGIDSALFGAVVTGFVRQAGREKDRPMLGFSLVVGLGFAVKCAWELRQGTALFAHSAGIFVPVPLAHLLGASWGVAVSLRGRFSIGTVIPEPGHPPPRRAGQR